MTPAQPLAGYGQFAFAHEGIEHPVHHAGDPTHPPVLLMPELSGLAPGLLLFAARLREAGFQVYLPQLFGVVGRRAPLRNVLRLCIAQEFAALRAGVSAPVTLWLRALATCISDRHGGGHVAAIGMCLTGAFAIPLILNPRVVAAVAAQPSVPLSPAFAALGFGRSARQGALNVSASDIDSARTRLASGQAHLLAVRCRPDRLCPQAKMARLQAEFPVGLEVREYGAADWRNALGARPHATYTKEYRLEPQATPDHPSRQAFADLIAFLDRHLRGATG